MSQSWSFNMSTSVIPLSPKLPHSASSLLYQHGKLTSTIISAGGHNGSMREIKCCLDHSKWNHYIHNLARNNAAKTSAKRTATPKPQPIPEPKLRGRKPADPPPQKPTPVRHRRPSRPCAVGLHPRASFPTPIHVLAPSRIF